jgi:glycerol-3-phosphate dehydrogenase (NAD(P)+)
LKKATTCRSEINKRRTNSVYLPEFSLPTGLKATHRIAEAVGKARYVLNVVPTQFIRPVFMQVADLLGKGAIIISASKGIEQGTLLTGYSILRETVDREIAVLSGPSFAKEVLQKRPTAVTLLLQEIFNTNYFRVYTHRDITGVELGGALKNVIAIASGICDGLGLGHNARAALITRGLAEITRLGECLGADKMTFSGLSGLGDLVLTCTGPLSRNYSVGIKLGQGRKLAEILASTRSVAEGVATSLSAFELSRKCGVEMPIIEQVYRVIHKDENPADAVNMLMNRALKAEF